MRVHCWGGVASPHSRGCRSSSAFVLPFMGHARQLYVLRWGWNIAINYFFFLTHFWQCLQRKPSTQITCILYIYITWWLFIKQSSFTFSFNELNLKRAFWYDFMKLSCWLFFLRDPPCFLVLFQRILYLSRSCPMACAVRIRWRGLKIIHCNIIHYTLYITYTL